VGEKGKGRKKRDEREKRKTRKKERERERERRETRDERGKDGMHLRMDGFGEKWSRRVCGEDENSGISERIV